LWVWGGGVWGGGGGGVGGGGQNRGRVALDLTIGRVDAKILEQKIPTEKKKSRKTKLKMIPPPHESPLASPTKKGLKRKKNIKLQTAIKGMVSPRGKKGVVPTYFWKK